MRIRVYIWVVINLSVVQTENVVEDVVRTILGDQVEGLREHLRVGFIIDLRAFVYISYRSSIGKISQIMPPQKMYLPRVDQ